jgi:hypothetical protein
MELQGTEIFPLPAGFVSYRYLNLDFREWETFSPEKGFRYEQVPFKTGFSVRGQYPDSLFPLSIQWHIPLRSSD